jgi:hypothetical protein
MIGLHPLSTPICLHPDMVLPHQIFPISLSLSLQPAPRSAQKDAGEEQIQPDLGALKRERERGLVVEKSQHRWERGTAGRLVSRKSEREC